MSEAGLIHRHRRPHGITKADTETQNRENLIKRYFSADKPLKKLFTDITEVQCADGKLYVSPILDVTANPNQPLMRKAEASNETSALIIIAIDYTLQPTTVTLPYCQLLYLTVSLPAIRRQCHAPRHYRFKLCFSWICTPLGQAMPTT